MIIFLHKFIYTYTYFHIYTLHFRVKTIILLILMRNTCMLVQKQTKKKKIQIVETAQTNRLKLFAIEIIRVFYIKYSHFDLESNYCKENYIMFGLTLKFMHSIIFRFSSQKSSNNVI